MCFWPENMDAHMGVGCVGAGCGHGPGVLSCVLQCVMTWPSVQSSTASGGPSGETKLIRVMHVLTWKVQPWAARPVC